MALQLPPGSFEYCQATNTVRILNNVRPLLSAESERGGNSDSFTLDCTSDGVIPSTPPPPASVPLSSNRCNTVHPPLSMRSIAEMLDPILEVVVCPGDSSLTPGRFLQLKKAAIREVYQELVRFIRTRVKSYSYSTAKHCAELVFAFDGGKYAKIFEVKVGSTVRSGLSTFTTQVYNQLNYRKDASEKRPRSNTARRQLELDDPDEPAAIDKTSAAYGCVAYEVSLPAGQTEDSQEETRLQLLEVDPHSNEAEVLMERTFPSQRMLMNSAQPLKSLVPKLFREWPLLQSQRYLLTHARRLLGKDVGTVWSTNMSSKCGRFVDFMLAHWSTEDLRKSTSSTRKMLDILTERSTHALQLGANLVNCLAVMPLLVGYFKEQQSLLYQVLPATTTDAEISALMNENPVLIIRGQSLFDPRPKADLVIANKLIPIAEPLDGFLLLILLYFIFGLKYPAKISNTLEFIQRQFLDINPEKGSRREGPPSKVTGLAPKVRNLSENLIFHSTTWATCRF